MYPIIEIIMSIIGVLVFISLFTSIITFIIDICKDVDVGKVFILSLVSALFWVILGGGVLLTDHIIHIIL